MLLFVFLAPVLRSMGNYLVYEDKLQPSDAVFVLGGNSLERGIAAHRLYQLNQAKHYYTTGKNIPSILEALDKKMTEAEVTRFFMIQSGADSTAVTALNVGTSTFEEAEFILSFAQKNRFRKIIILSSKFHTRRIRSVFKKIFRKSNIEVFITGADPNKYKLEKWWHEEEGLLMVNNEYVKLFYYWWVYSPISTLLIFLLIFILLALGIRFLARLK